MAASASDVSILVAGANGLIGSHIVKTLLSLPATDKCVKIEALFRRTPTNPNIPRDTSTTKPTVFEPLILSDPSTWPAQIRSKPTAPRAFITALGTSRGRAGSLAEQRKIDYDLNLSLCRAAQEHKTPICVVISSAGADATARFPYLKMKGEIDEAIGALGFKHTIVLRPGLLVGQREDSRPGTSTMGMLANGLARISPSLADFWAQDANVVARAAVHALRICEEGKHEQGTWILSQADIVKLGRTEWIEESGPST